MPSPQSNVVPISNAGGGGARSGTSGGPAASEGNSWPLKGGGGGGNSGGMTEVPVKEYLDARLGEARAQTDAKFAVVDAKFAEVLAAIHSLNERMATRASVWGAAATAAAAILGVMLAVLAFGGDRFDAGMTAASDDDLARENAQAISDLTATVQSLYNTVQQGFAARPPAAPPTE